MSTNSGHKATRRAQNARLPSSIFHGRSLKLPNPYLCRKESLAAEPSLSPLVEHFSRTILCEARRVHLLGCDFARIRLGLRFQEAVMSALTGPKGLTALLCMS